jgi:AmiR/NasT family two-component response regulator
MGDDSLACSAMSLGQEPSLRADASADQVAAREQQVEQLTRQVEQLNQQVGQLMSAVESNRVSATAMGILMERHRLDRAGAFRFLLRVSQNGNFRLRGLAESLVEEAERKCR